LQEEFLLLVSFAIGLSFVYFPIRSALLLTAATTGIAFWSHIVAAFQFLQFSIISLASCAVRVFRSCSLAVIGGVLLAVAKVRSV